jgi:hypothetical protein
MFAIVARWNFKVEKLYKQGNIEKQIVYFLLGLVFHPRNRRGVFLQIFGLLPNYTA